MSAKLFLSESEFQTIRNDITMLARSVRVTKSKGNLNVFLKALEEYFLVRKINQGEYWQDVATRKR